MKGSAASGNENRLRDHVHRELSPSSGRSPLGVRLRIPGTTLAARSTVRAVCLMTCWAVFLVTPPVCWTTVLVMWVMCMRACWTWCKALCWARASLSGPILITAASPVQQKATPCLARLSQPQALHTDPGGGLSFRDSACRPRQDRGIPVMSAWGSQRSTGATQTSSSFSDHNPKMCRPLCRNSGIPYRGIPGTMPGTITTFTSASRQPPGEGVENRSFTREMIALGWRCKATIACLSLFMAVSAPASPQQMEHLAASLIPLLDSPRTASVACTLPTVLASSSAQHRTEQP
mmetsp:Transcript_27301/g.70844  ORF Transcript_27301/g.70844 Transcript_27301/m.70844 type:complete len:291 (-) Transcript_27301:265-1137(-)